MKTSRRYRGSPAGGFKRYEEIFITIAVSVD
jgi:hypothetical protein